MSTIDVNNLLSQMRTLAAQAKLGTGAPVAAPSVGGGADFSGLLKNAINGVEGQQQNASRLTDAFERGDSSADIGQVMVALQKADLSFKAMSEVRNKLVDAYKDIMNMPV